MTKVFNTKWFNITKFNYGESEYYKLNQSEGIVILPLTKKNELILIQQYRPCLKKKNHRVSSWCLRKK